MMVKVPVNAITNLSVELIKLLLTYKLGHYKSFVIFWSGNCKNDSISFVPIYSR